MTYLYKNKNIDIELRVSDLLSRMTLEEKYAQMHAFWLILSEDGNHTERLDVIDEMMGAEQGEDFNIRLKKGIGQITRPLGTHVVSPHEGVRALNRIQKTLMEESRLGIPAMSHEECLVGLLCKDATLFPSPLNYGATWDPELVRKAAESIGREARSVGCHQGLAPVLDVSRDVRWGRTEETFGEDPYLVGIMAVSYVKGLQGPNRDMLATLKHYAAHSFSEGARNHAPVHLGFRELNDVFLLPFEMAVKLANAGSVMPAYHDIDGKPSHCDPLLLTEILREKWGFDGLIVADYGGVSLLHQHHGVSQNCMESAALAYNAGLDIELPKDDCARFVPDAVSNGLISLDTINAIVSRILREKFRLGLFENPYVDENNIDLQSESALEVARDVAAGSLTLLTNNGILPLTPGADQKIALIGPTAADPLALLSGYSFPVHLIISEMTTQTEQIVTPLQAFEKCFGKDNIRYARGCDILTHRIAGTPVFPGDTGKKVGTSPVSKDTSQIAEAVELAKNSDVAVLFVGDLSGLFQSGTVGEGSDTQSLKLPGVQQQLTEAVLATGTPVILVMTSGRPYNLAGLEENLAALLLAYQPGQEGGTAIADLISGKTEPKGRLPFSIPKTAGAMPYFYNHKLKSCGSPVAFHFGSLYPFGHGKTWTEFSYSDFSLNEREIDIKNGLIEANITVNNTGKKAGTEVVQVYIKDMIASLVRPVQELKAFKRVHMQPGEQVRLHFFIPTHMLNFTSDTGERIVEPGEFEIQVGASSGDIRARGVVRVEGSENYILPKKWHMVSYCEVECSDVY